MSDEQGARNRDRIAEGNNAEKRLEQRYEVPAVYRRYIQLRVKAGSDFVPAILNNFSRHGILFECMTPLGVDTHTDCILSMSSLLSRDISFGIVIKHCVKKDTVFLIGGVVETIADETWFNVFAEVHDFIVERKDSVY